MLFARRAACVVMAVMAVTAVTAVTAVVAGVVPRASARTIDADPVSAPPGHSRRSTASASVHDGPRPVTPVHAVTREMRMLPPSRHERHDGSSEEGRHEHGRTTRHAAKRAPPPRPLRAVRSLPPNAPWRSYRRRPWQRGFVTLFGHGQKWSGYLVDKYGDVIPAARKSISGVLASWRTGKQMLIDDRLLGLVADVSDEFGGRPIRIVSGYREHSYAPDSRHKTGEAFDFSVPEVPNEAVRDFLRSLPDVGVGYYPNSTHVHLDVRDKPTYWVDYSRPGDQPLYAWDRRVAGFTPRERVLAAALDSIASHARANVAVPISHAKTTPVVVDPPLRPVSAVPERPKRAAVASSAAVAHAVDLDAAEDEREEDAGNRGGIDAGGPSVAEATAKFLPKAPAASSVSEMTEGVPKGHFGGVR